MLWLLELEADVDGKTEKTVETYSTIDAAMIDYKSASHRFKNMTKIGNLKTSIRLIETDEKFTNEKVVAAATYKP